MSGVGREEEEEEDGGGGEGVPVSEEQAIADGIDIIKLETEE